MRVSMTFSVRPRRPISVRGFSSSTRWERSPAAMASAVAPILSRGRSPRRTSHHARAPSAASVAAPTASSIHSRRPSVSLTSASGIAITMRAARREHARGDARLLRAAQPPVTASTRYSPAPGTSTSE